MEGLNARDINFQEKKSFHHKNKRKTSYSLLLTFFILIISIFLTKVIYLEIKCKNFKYAINHELCTSSKTDTKLLRVQSSKLIFFDNEKAVITAYGLSKDKPHRETKLEGQFRKDLLGSWKLDQAYTYN